MDVVIVGAGIAGLWMANLLRSRGYACVVLEADDAGGEQTLASQGLIHGGLKYALGGSLTGASEAIARMPVRWRRCLEGEGEVDLSALTPLSSRYCMFAADSTLGRLTTFFASRMLQGRVSRLEPADYPPALAVPDFRGTVYALNDFVLDTRELIAALHVAVADTIYRHRLEPGAVTATEDGVRLTLDGRELSARRLLLTAGAGTEPLLQGLQSDDAPRMQRRPLHQVMVRHRYPHPLFAHCLTGIRRPEPRLTITSHRVDGPGETGDWLWYLGGQIATEGVHMTTSELIHHARGELEACLPWIPWKDAHISTLRIDRAEPAQESGRRPDEAFARACGNAIVAWPTKLSLVPDLGDRVLALLPPPRQETAPALDLPRPGLGRPPWCA